MTNGKDALDPLDLTLLADDEIPTDVLAGQVGTTSEIPLESESLLDRIDFDAPPRVTAPLVLPELPQRASAQMAIRGHTAVEFLRSLGTPLVDHYVLDILDRESATAHPSLWYRRYAELLIVAQDRLAELLPVHGMYIDDRTRRYLAKEILYLADCTASIVVSYLDVSAEQHIKSAYKGWIAAEDPITAELSVDKLNERREARHSRLELFRAELDSIKIRLYESFLVNITLPLGQLVASLDKCETDLQRDFYLGMIAFGAPLSLIMMSGSAAEFYPREQIGEFEFDLVLLNREVNESSTRRKVAVTLVEEGGDTPQALRDLDARDRERALARYGWTGLVFTEHEIVSDLRGCVEQVCKTHRGPLSTADEKAARRGISSRFST